VSCAGCTIAQHLWLLLAATRGKRCLASNCCKEAPPAAASTAAAGVSIHVEAHVSPCLFSCLRCCSCSLILSFCNTSQVRLHVNISDAETQAVWQSLCRLVQLLLCKAVAAARWQKRRVEPGVEQFCATTEHLHNSKEDVCIWLDLVYLML
jgi:hypothetical protein